MTKTSNMVTYATLVETDGRTCTVEVLRCPVTRTRDGRVSRVLTGKGERVALVRLACSTGVRLEYGELAAQHATPDAPAFEWGSNPGVPR